MFNKQLFILIWWLIAGISTETVTISDCKLGEELNPAATACTRCRPGHYRNSTMSECAKCAVNSIAPYRESILYENCPKCSDGAVADEPRWQCIECRIGTYRSSDLTVCTGCPLNTYASSTGSSECAECGAGTAANSLRTGCDKCPVGEYRSSDMDTCSKCATDGTEPNIEQSTCVDIPTCGPVNIPNSIVRSDSEEQLRGTVVHVTCTDGFHHVGTESITCQVSRDWSHDSIVDTARTCQRLGEIK